MNEVLIASFDSGWVGALGTVIVGAAAVGAILLDRGWRQRQERKQEKEDAVEAPARELNATSQAAETVARAAAALLDPLQRTIANMQTEQGALREAVTVSRTAEEKCKDELAEVRADLALTKAKLREVTDRLQIPPNG